MPTEASIIPRAIFNFTFRINMSKRTLSVATCHWKYLIKQKIRKLTIFRKKKAFGHFTQIIFMQKFALITFFTEAP